MQSPLYPTIQNIWKSLDWDAIAQLLKSLGRRLAPLDGGHRVGPANARNRVQNEIGIGTTTDCMGGYVLTRSMEPKCDTFRPCCTGNIPPARCAFATRL
jgi:hypothetical protein